MTGNAADEVSPLLSAVPNVYDRFTRREKYLIVAVVSWVGYLPCKFISLQNQLSETEIVQYLFQGLSCLRYLT